MWAFIWLGLVSLTVLSLLMYDHFHKQKAAEGFVSSVDDPTCPMGSISKKPGKICTGMTSRGESGAPSSYTVDIVKQSKINQPPFPPCVGYVDEVVYAPTDTNADIAQIKADLALLQKNMPNYMADGVNQQTGPIVKGMLRQQGFPLTDDKYGQNTSPLNCN